MTKLDEELAELLRSPSAAVPIVVLTPALWHGRCSGDQLCGRCGLCRALAKVSIAGETAKRSEKHDAWRPPRRYRFGSPEAAFRAWVIAAEAVGARSGLGRSLEAFRLGLPLGGGVPSSGGAAEGLGVELPEVTRAIRHAIETWDGAVPRSGLLRVVEALLVGVVPPPQKRKRGGQRKRDDHGRISVSTRVVAEAVGVDEDGVREALAHVMQIVAIDLAVAGLLAPPKLGTRARVEVAHRVEARTRRSR